MTDLKEVERYFEEVSRELRDSCSFLVLLNPEEVQIP
jgi:hypothetical protein